MPGCAIALRHKNLGITLRRARSGGGLDHPAILSYLERLAENRVGDMQARGPRPSQPPAETLWDAWSKGAQSMRATTKRPASRAAAYKIPSGLGRHVTQPDR